MQSESKVHVTGNVYRHDPYTHYIGNQIQPIQALTMLARGDVSNVRRAFGCHRNTVIRLHKRFKQTGGVADSHRPGRPRVTNPRTDRFVLTSFSNCDKFCKAVRYHQTVLRCLRQAWHPFGRGGPIRDKCLQHVIRLPVCSVHNGISVGGDSSGLGFYSLMSLGLTLVIMNSSF